MKQTLFQEKYPLFTLEVLKSETTFNSVDEILAFFKEKIDAHDVASFIATFDHYHHTQALPMGQVSPAILDAKNIIFCFGTALPAPAVMAVRPRSIGVTELQDRFVINFMEAPMPLANNSMEAWAKAVANL